MIKLNMNLPPDIARRFVEDIEAFYAEPNAIKQDEIAARQLHILREHRKPRDPKLRLPELEAGTVARSNALASLDNIRWVMVSRNLHP